MEYHHSRKAGNPGDVVKHALLAELLSRLPFPATEPVVYFDVHAGPALHRLGPEGEWREGIGRLDLATREEALPYERVLRGEPFGWPANATSRLYPGSSLLARSVLVERGLRVRLVCCEIDPAVCRELAAGFRELGIQKATVLEGDGNALLASRLKDSAARPGFVLFDPPAFEERSVLEGLGGCALAGVPAMAWLPVVRQRDESSAGVPRVLESCRSAGFQWLEAAWPRPGREGLCTRGCLCIAARVSAEDFGSATRAVVGRGLPEDWTLSTS